MEPLWSPWPQPVAVTRKSTGSKDPENKAKSVAVGRDCKSAVAT
jgi:hypothetical protein